MGAVEEDTEAVAFFDEVDSEVGEPVIG